jgi:hypothetical protein
LPKGHLGLPKTQTQLSKILHAEAATRWFDAELADSDEEGIESSDADDSEEDGSDSSNNKRVRPSRLRGGGRKGGSSPDSSDNSSSKDKEKSDSDDDSDDDQKAIKRLRRKLTKKEIKVSKNASKSRKHIKRSKKGCKKPSRLSDILNPEALWARIIKFLVSRLRSNQRLLTFYAPKASLWMHRRN